jgi:hypothetical protein
MSLPHPIPQLGPARPIAHKYITKYNLAKLFEDTEKPFRLERVLPDGEPILDAPQ